MWLCFHQYTISERTLIGSLEYSVGGRAERHASQGSLGYKTRFLWLVICFVSQHMLFLEKWVVLLPQAVWAATASKWIPLGIKMKIQDLLLRSKILSVGWWAQLGWLPDAHPAAFSCPVLQRGTELSLQKEHSNPDNQNSTEARRSGPPRKKNLGWKVRLPWIKAWNKTQVYL